MLLRCWFAIMLLISLNILTHSSLITSKDNSKFVSSSEEKHINYIDRAEDLSNVKLLEPNSGQDIERSTENSGSEQAELPYGLFDANYVPLAKSSIKIPFESEIALPQHDQASRDLKQESSSQNFEFEIKESTESDFDGPESDFITHSPSTFDFKSTEQVYTDKKSEIYETSGNEHTLSTENLLKPNFDKKDLQHRDTEKKQIIHTYDPTDKLLSHDQTQRVFTEVDEETLLNQVDENFPYKFRTSQLKSTGQSKTEDNINQGTLLKEAKDSLTHEMTGGSELNTEHAEVEDRFRFKAETGLDNTGESFSHDNTGTIELKSIKQTETEDNINEEIRLESTSDLAREMVGYSELNLKKHAEIEDDFKFKEVTLLNPTVESLIHDPDGKRNSKSSQQVEEEHEFKISRNGLNENSQNIANDREEAVGSNENDNFHLVNPSFKKLNHDDMTDSEIKRPFDLNSYGESKLVLGPSRHSDNDFEGKFSNDIELFQSVTQPEGKITTKENFIISNISSNVNLGRNSDQSGSLQHGDIGSAYNARNTTFIAETENDEAAEIPGELDVMHATNYKPEPDNFVRNNTESVVSKDINDEIKSDKVKVNKKNQTAFIMYGTTNCLETTTSTDHEIVDFNSDSILKIQKVRAVGRAIASAGDSKLIRNASTNEENKGAFEYLENIEFNLHKVVHIIKTDGNVRAFILNSLILYVPVLVCDVFLWIVIVTLIRHIRRFLVSNNPPQTTQNLNNHKNEAGDITRWQMKSKRLEDSEDDSYGSSSEFSEQNVWYPPT